MVSEVPLHTDSLEVDDDREADVACRGTSLIAYRGTSLIRHFNPHGIIIGP